MPDGIERIHGNIICDIRRQFNKPAGDLPDTDRNQFIMDS